jgi:hypothetical protein
MLHCLSCPVLELRKRLDKRHFDSESARSHWGPFTLGRQQTLRSVHMIPPPRTITANSVSLPSGKEWDTRSGTECALCLLRLPCRSLQHDYQRTSSKLISFHPAACRSSVNQ